jgi:hypothetical protein
MKRILIMNRNTWLANSKGLSEIYLRQIFSRIAAQGHYVAWLGARDQSVKKTDNATQVHDFIHLAPVGMPIFYPIMSRIFLARLCERPKGAPFDLVVQCVTKWTIQLPTAPSLKVLPVFFHPPGRRVLRALSAPYIVANERADAALRRLGIPDKQRIRIFPGNSVESWNKASGMMLGAIENLDMVED